jgi:hypothetical protein
MAAARKNGDLNADNQLDFLQSVILGSKISERKERLMLTWVDLDEVGQI